VAHLYLTDQHGPWQPGDAVFLTGDEAHHAARVGRLAVGETTWVSEGVGTKGSARVQAVSAQDVTLQIQSSVQETPALPELWLAQALAKGDRDEVAIQASTELGVDHVIPLQADRSISLWRGDKVDKGIARWTKIVTEASKQALRARVPTVHPLVTTAGLVPFCQSHRVIVLDPEAIEKLSEYEPVGETPLLLVVGPEGGLSPHEIATLVAAGAITRRLGDTVLRTSSAGPAALAVLNMTLRRW